MDTEENEIKGLDAELLTSLARRYYATRFPNPQRLGCLPRGEIIKVLSERRVPDQALREHLFECSECFGEYRQALAQSQPAPDKFTWRKLLASIGALKLTAAAIALLILSSPFFFDGLIPRKPALEAGQITSSPPSGARAGDSGVSAPDQTATTSVAAISEGNLAMDKERKSSSILRPGALGAETFEVDLDNYQVFRRSRRDELNAVNEKSSDREGAITPGEPDTAPPGEKIISLPATRANLVLRLPETGVPGKYIVSLIDGFGRPLLTNSAFSFDGVKLRMTLDLRRVPRKKYRLRLWRNNEAPAFYDVIIGAR
jgi:hypothetical protein